ncbi:MAG TPA: hypothetical protein VFA41_16160 [Ktedonobacteraceae bacterium]|jgi:translation initiation factor 2B subunit (eIF-2B alpha/beta/delta family)|nr:hypothetical protein [Ktedonobacteraceae bacterium]
MIDIQKRIDQIRHDREHGSRWLVRETISLLHDIASDGQRPEQERMRMLEKAGRELAQARPAMAAIAGAVSRVVYAQGGIEQKAQAAAQLLRDYDTSLERITNYARPLLTGTLMTHSLSGTVLEVLKACKEQIERIIVLEGRPRYEGREVAQQLSQNGIAVTLITDAQADIFLPQCQAVLVGADSILADGSVLNKAGTALVAWAARGHGKAFYVLSETLKISPHRWTGNLEQLEEKEPEEVLEQAIPGVTARNFYFDHTLASLITTILTEQGPLDVAQVQHIASTLKAVV